MVVPWLRICACQCRAREFDPWSRKIPHAMGQLSLCTTSTEACTLELVLNNKRSSRFSVGSLSTPTREQPLLPTARESVGPAAKSQRSQKSIDKVSKVLKNTFKLKVDCCIGCKACTFLLLLDTEPGQAGRVRLEARRLF